MPPTVKLIFVHYFSHSFQQSCKMCYCPYLTRGKIREVKLFPQSHTARKMEIQKLSVVLFDLVTRVLSDVWGEHEDTGEDAEAVGTRDPGPGIQATGLRTSVSHFCLYEALSLNQD